MFLCAISPKQEMHNQRSFFETTATEEPFIGCVLFDIGSLSLLSGVGMMFMLHRFIF
jgi:hypothetical protein